MWYFRYVLNASVVVEQDKPAMMTKKREIDIYLSIFLF